ncbi:MAG: CsbD family protein [Pseudomonadota bacterium]
MREFAIIAAAAALSIVAAPTAPLQAQTTAPAAPTPARPGGSTDTVTFWEKIKGGWEQTKGAVKEQWGRLTDDDLLEIEGRREQLVGRIQTRYGITREQAEAQVNTWEQKRLRDM